VVETWSWVTEWSNRFGLTPAEFWDFVLRALIALGALIAAAEGARRYFKARREDRILRREEIAWRRTELINGLADQFDKDASCQDALKVIAQYRHGHRAVNLKKALDPDAKKLRRSEADARYLIERYLDFFDRLYTYIYITEVITAREALFFSGYIDEIAEVAELRNFAQSCGYAIVLELAPAFRVVRQLQSIAPDSQEEAEDLRRSIEGRVRGLRRFA
jgi:hypothetical protein